MKQTSQVDILICSYFDSFSIFVCLLGTRILFFLGVLISGSGEESLELKSCCRLMFLVKICSLTFGSCCFTALLPVSSCILIAPLLCLQMPHVCLCLFIKPGAGIPFRLKKDLTLLRQSLGVFSLIL